MLKLLPFILIPVLIIGGLGYFRFVAIRQSITASAPLPIESNSNNGPIEVPKTLPNQTTDDKVKILEDTISKLVAQVNGLKTQSTQTTAGPSALSLDTRLKDIEGLITDLKARISALEKASPAPAAASTTKAATVYIPLGSGGGPWANKDWYSTADYQVILDPANYPGYTGMNLEVTYKLSEQAGTASVRLYNSTDTNTTSSQVDTTSSNIGLYTSSAFKLPTGSKTYVLQVKSTEGKDIFIQTARIRVNF